MYRIFSLEGKLMKQGMNIKGESIEVGLLSSGYYIIALEADGKMVSKKFVKS